jgi:hypothetical protein
MQAQFNDLYSANVSAMKRVAESNWRVWGRFREQQIKLLDVCADCGQRQLALWNGNGNGAQKPAEFFAAQADIGRQVSEQLVEYSQVMLTSTRDAANEIMSCIEGLSEPLSRPANDDGGENQTLKGARMKRSAA